MSASLTKTHTWQALSQHVTEMKSASLPEIVLGDPKRLENCEITLDGLRLNYALNRVTPKTIELLVDLAREKKLEDRRQKMFAGEKINVTENRAVLHTALRAKSGKVLVDGRDVMPDVKAVQDRIAKFVGDVHDGRRTGATGKPFKHIVNIGIGGSDLGPRLAVRALDSFAKGPQVHFVANADAFDLFSVIKHLDPAETLFIVVSKTFTTQETLLNARSAREWVAAKLGAPATAKHFIAVSTNVPEAGKFGIAAADIFPMWDWVGGRYSLWSAVGISVALAIGMENWRKLLDGAAAMDAHFREAPLVKNMPVLLALLGIWQRNFLGAASLAILPYSERLRDLPRYLQQLEMESNGKSVTREGEKMDTETAPVIFGECGTVGQHSFHQWLHQGTDMIPVDFIGIVEDDLNHPEHHRVLMMNMAAQMAALAFGRPDAAKPHEVYAGGRSSTMIALDRLDPACFGMLLALYEHKTFAQGVLWDINSFDQPGVELGKELAQGLESRDSAGNLAIFAENLLQRLSFPKK